LAILKADNELARPVSGMSHPKVNDGYDNVLIDQTINHPSPFFRAVHATGADVGQDLLQVLFLTNNLIIMVIQDILELTLELYLRDLPEILKAERTKKNDLIDSEDEFRTEEFFNSDIAILTDLQEFLPEFGIEFFFVILAGQAFQLVLQRIEPVSEKIGGKNDEAFAAVSYRSCRIIDLALVKKS
jgi:hypothetical protein